MYHLWTLIAKIALRRSVFRIFYLEILKEFSARTKNLCSSRYVLQVRDVKEASEVIFSWSIGSRNVGLIRGSKWYYSGTKTLMEWKQRCPMHSELNSVCIRHLCFRGLLLRRAETAIGVLEDMLLWWCIPVLLVPKSGTFRPPEWNSQVRNI